MVMAVKQFEKLFRESASLDIDKNDIKRLENFINQRVCDLMIRAQANAKANQRDIIQVQDLPVTKGLQEQIQFFKGLDEELNLGVILEHLTKLPPLALEYSEEVEQKLPELVGAITVSSAKLFKITNPKLKNPGSAEWDQVEQIFDLLQ
jgi:hypothetical protein